MDIAGIWWMAAIWLATLFGSFFVGLRLYSSLKKERSRNTSLSVKYGRLTEQFLPLVQDYPWDPSNFRFLGSPIDGVQFEDDQVIFVEFKSGKSTLSRKQRHIRDLITNGKVDFRLLRVNE